MYCALRQMRANVLAEQDLAKSDHRSRLSQSIFIPATQAPLLPFEDSNRTLSKPKNPNPLSNSGSSPNAKLFWEQVKSREKTYFSYVENHISLKQLSLFNRPLALANPDNFDTVKGFLDEVGFELVLNMRYERREWEVIYSLRSKTD